MPDFGVERVTGVSVLKIISRLMVMLAIAGWVCSAQATLIDDEDILFGSGGTSRVGV